MPFYINNEERDALIEIGADANEINLAGIRDADGVPFAANVFPVIVEPPVGPYNTLVPQIPLDPTLAKVIDGSGGFMSIVYRRTSPIADGVVEIVPTPIVISDTTPTVLKSYTYPNPIYTPRRVLVTVNFSCFSTISGKSIEFWLEYGVGGASSTTHSKFLLPRPSEYHTAPVTATTSVESALSHSHTVTVVHTLATEPTHQQISQCWGVELPALTSPSIPNPPIILVAKDMTGGTGTIELSLDDTVSVSIAG
jgi:hypothetical protein